MRKGEPKAHHILPRCYLKGFTNSDKKIFIYTLNSRFNKKVRESSLKGVAYKEDFYTLLSPVWDTFAEVKDPLIIEKKINKRFEDNLIKLFSNFVNRNATINFGTAYEIAELLLHLKRRNIYCMYPLFQTVICCCISFFSSKSFHSKGVLLPSPS